MKADDDRDHEEAELLEMQGLLSSLLKENQSENFKLKKRVSFKLPEEADIILIYSPEKTFSDHEDSM